MVVVAFIEPCCFFIFFSPVVFKCTRTEDELLTTLNDRIILAFKKKCDLIRFMNSNVVGTNLVCTFVSSLNETRTKNIASIDTRVIGVLDEEGVHDKWQVNVTVFQVLKIDVLFPIIFTWLNDKVLISVFLDDEILAVFKQVLDISYLCFIRDFYSVFRSFFFELKLGLWEFFLSELS